MNNGNTFTILVIIIALVGATLSVYAIIARTNQQQSIESLLQATPTVSGTIPVEPAFKVEKIKEGSGTAAKVGDTVSVHYTGKLGDGTQFDSSVGREPFTFKLGTGAVIVGWDQALVGMKKGEKAKLTIPSAMAYGPTGRGSIPPYATLYFEIELVDIK